MHCPHFFGPAGRRAEISEVWNKPGQQLWSPYILAKLSEVRSTHLLEQSGEIASPLKLYGGNVRNSQ